MSAETRYMAATWAAVVVPLVGFCVSVALVWQRWVGWLDLALLVAMYTVTGLGATVGFHRLLTHRSFATTPAVRNALAILGSMAGQGPPLTWVADHRRHHTFADEEGDPHTPHGYPNQGALGVVRGLWHAHVGWLFHARNKQDVFRYGRDLLQEPAMIRISRAYIPIVLLGLLLPFCVGFGISGTIRGGISALVVAGLARMFLFHHISWSVNSIGHFAGRRSFATDDESRNVAWLALPSMGDSWHNNHHAFPTSPRHGFTWSQVDLSWLAIVGLVRVGLAEVRESTASQPSTADRTHAPLGRVGGTVRLRGRDRRRAAGDDSATRWKSL